MDLRTDQFDYDLPGELIAQQPTPRRDGSRLLVIDRRTETFTHRHFYDLPEYLQMGDVLVANRSRVRPARLLAHRETGGAVELLLLHSTAGHDWIALARPSRKLRPGMTLNIDGSRLEAILRAPEGDGRWSVTFRGEEI
jgi:S-adenosylmethionine:tRNA ribosyltransferase-isomerase